MPSYVNSAFQVPVVLQKGVNAYFYGSYNAKQANTRMLVNQVTLASNVATLAVQIVEGEIPIVGALVSVQQTITSTGLFNVARAAITAVSINAQTGAGTISYALTGANVGPIADYGTAIAEVPEIAETLALNSSVPVCMVAPESDSQATVTVSVTFPTAPTSATVVLQEAIRDVNSEYTTLGNVSVYATGSYSTGPTTQFTLTRGNFYRLQVTALTGTGTIVGKIS